ncbi:hypothetical protein L6E12_31470 [Actinokineospora sp. PR83]|nr:hypothetical protein [Actinokineospora sp. PR83]
MPTVVMGEVVGEQEPQRARRVWQHGPSASSTSLSSTNTTHQGESMPFNPAVYAAKIDQSTPATIVASLLTVGQETGFKAREKREEAEGLRRAAAALPESVAHSGAAERLRREAAAADADAEELEQASRGFHDSAEEYRPRQLSA